MENVNDLDETTNIHTEKITWKCPSNIALVKYWGKYDGQIPANASLSITLSKSVTETSVWFQMDRNLKEAKVSFLFEGEKSLEFEKKIIQYLNARIPDFPFLSNLKLNIQTHNTFPHSAGIASSASGFGALALCLCSIEETLLKRDLSETDFFEKASSLARLGSGSACRSIYGGFVVWGQNSHMPLGTDFCGVPLSEPVHPLFDQMQDSIIVVSAAKKKVSSSAGHALMKDHPFALSRYHQAGENLSGIYSSLLTGDLDRFVQIVENEALTLHALMMSSNQSYLLLHPNTLVVIQKLRDFRNRTHVPVCFTLDAGPNVHIIYPEKYKIQVREFIDTELIPFCENATVIHDLMGNGPEKISGYLI